MADPDPDPASGEGIWIPRSSHRTMGGDAREEATPAVLIFTPYLFFLQRKTHHEASVFFLSTSVPSELLSQGSAGASLTGHTLDHVLVPPHWEGGSCPSLPPLLTSESTARHEAPQDQVFLHPSRFLALPALPFGFAPADWLCGHSPVPLRMCSGALGGFLMGRPMDS